MKKMTIIIIAFFILLCGAWYFLSRTNQSSASGGWVSLNIGIGDVVSYIFRSLKPAAADTITFSVPLGWSFTANRKNWDDTTHDWGEPSYEMRPPDKSLYFSFKRIKLDSAENRSVDSAEIRNELNSILNSIGADEISAVDACSIVNYRGICGYTTSHMGIEDVDLPSDIWAGYFGAKDDIAIQVISTYPSGQRSEMLKELQTIVSGMNIK
jgi:hypothetical protein